MPDDQDYTIGFQKPPKHTRFVKGKSGNPLGRPTGSQNATAVFDMACHERIRVTTNGEVRYMSKYRAAMMQLTNKAAAGDLRAMQLLLSWYTWRLHCEGQTAPAISRHERDKFVLAHMLDRIRNSEPTSLAAEPVPLVPKGDPEDPQ